MIGRGDRGRFRQFRLAVQDDVALGKEPRGGVAVAVVRGKPSGTVRADELARR